MKPRQPMNTPLTRRNLLVLTGACLSGCGGGDATLGSGPPGTGGTGVFAQGSISGFGSVIVNGIKFDDTQAVISLDGVTAASVALRLGMVADIKGRRDVSLMLGTASSIEIWSTAQGAVSQLASNAFTVAGMTIRTDSNTVFDGLASVAAMTPGLRVTVWGLQAGADGQDWIVATRVALASGSAVVSTGVISSMDSGTFVNGLRLTGSSMGQWMAGDMVRVQGVLSDSGDSIAVTSVRVMGPGASLQTEGEVEIEGLVTAVASPGRFMLGRFDVDASAVAFSQVSAQIVSGMRLKVTGTWQTGVLKATGIEVEGELALQSVEIKGAIEQFVSLSNFVVRGQRCNALLASMAVGTAEQLHNGILVEIKGIKAGDVLRVVDLELISG